MSLKFSPIKGIGLKLRIYCLHLCEKEIST